MITVLLYGFGACAFVALVALLISDVKLRMETAVLKVWIARGEDCLARTKDELRWIEVGGESEDGCWEGLMAEMDGILKEGKE